MDGTDCVAQCRFTVSAVFFCEFNCGFQITNVVECIENSNNINSVFNCFTAELFNNVIRIVLISQNVLSAEQHLKACMRECFFELSETFPRIFVQKTEAGIKSCTAPAFKRPVSHAVQNLACGKHLFRAHSRCGLGLMRIAQYSICNE